MCVGRPIILIIEVVFGHTSLPSSILKQTLRLNADLRRVGLNPTPGGVGEGLVILCFVCDDDLLFQASFCDYL